MKGGLGRPSRCERVGPVEEFGIGDGRSPVRSDVRDVALCRPGPRDQPRSRTRGETLTTLGIDLAVRAAHVATLASDRGDIVWTRRRFHNHPADLAALSAAAGPAGGLTVGVDK